MPFSMTIATSRSAATAWTASDCAATAGSAGVATRTVAAPQQECWSGSPAERLAAGASPWWRLKQQACASRNTVACASGMKTATATTSNSRLARLLRISRPHILRVGGAGSQSRKLPKTGTPPAWRVDCNGRAGEALAWLTNCPAKVRSEQPVPLALVDCYLATKDWEGLETSLQGQKWGDLEFLRLAFLSRTAAEQNQKLAADTRWRTALREAGDRLGPLISMLSMASTWGRQEAKEDLLWQIAQRFPRERWALRELDRSYLAAGNTRGLNKVYAAMASYAPQNLAAQNNLAATSLLLRINLAKAHQTAKELFSQKPQEAIVASTYAYSLHLQGRTKDGLAVLAKLKNSLLYQTFSSGGVSTAG